MHGPPKTDWDCLKANHLDHKAAEAKPAWRFDATDEIVHVVWHASRRCESCPCPKRLTRRIAGPDNALDFRQGSGRASGIEDFRILQPSAELSIEVPAEIGERCLRTDEEVDGEDEVAGDGVANCLEGGQGTVGWISPAR